jgi:hypothetical protein
MLFPLKVTFRRYHAKSQTSHQEQDEYDYQYYTDDSAGSVAPAAGVRPCGDDPDQYQDQDNQQDGANAHGLLLWTGTVIARIDPLTGGP